MNVPQPQNIISQCFRSDFIEFVWLFGNQLLICKISKPASIYMEAGPVDVEGACNFITPPEILDIAYGNLGVDGIITSPLNWNNRRFPEVYKNLNNGQDLVPLVAEVQEYLKSI